LAANGAVNVLTGTSQMYQLCLEHFGKGLWERWNICAMLGHTKHKKAAPLNCLSCSG
jgi:hypothetical protein